ncbi:MAG: DUF2281 domain-containing protein [Chloroflexota bacterium]
MATPRILQDIASLPPEAQKQVRDFVAFLKMRYGGSSPKSTKRGQWENEPFFGMWKDRKEMQDSRKWVRDLRRKQWNRKA